MKTLEFTDEELLYVRRALDVYVHDLKEYISETGHSALDPALYDEILDRVEDAIDGGRSKRIALGEEDPFAPPPPLCE